MDKNILVGNGINIAFSRNDDYKNYAIIERLTRYLRTDRYDDVFHGSITSAELLELLNSLNEYFNKMLKGISALKLTQTNDELLTLVDISKRYHSKSKDLLSVGIEDYFFVMKMVFNKFGDEQTPINLLYDGLKYLFLDSIYNDGKIETLYTAMAPFGKELEKYSKIFTVNYDTNLDKLTKSKVYHLHGSFDVLDDTYKSDTIIGYIAQAKDNPPTVVMGKEHLFCNAVMAFSGQRKLEIINTYSNGNKALSTMITRLNDPVDREAKAKLENLKNATDENNQFAYKSICAKLEHPELGYTEYPFGDFQSIQGELHIIGMSPNNDSHLFTAINDNPNITRVVYFSAGDEDTLAAQKVIKKPLQIRNVFKYWKSIGC